jgi:hypothetical protein
MFRKIFVLPLLPDMLALGGRKHAMAVASLKRTTFKMKSHCKFISWLKQKGDDVKTTENNPLSVTAKELLMLLRFKFSRDLVSFQLG